MSARPIHIIEQIAVSMKGICADAAAVDSRQTDKKEI